jgi:predicted amidohydrolase
LKRKSFKLALAQIHLEPGDRDQNLTRAARFIHSAADSGANIILLPEAFPLGWMDPSAVTLADEIPRGSTCRQLATLARDTGTYICSGVIERCKEKIFNSAVLINPSGEVILHHRKINELAIAHDLYSLGDRLAVADTPLGRIGLMICADAFAPGHAITRALGLMGAEIILSPCAWAVSPDLDNTADPYGSLWVNSYAPVCREFGLWIAGCSSVGPIRTGPWQGHRCIGSSLVLDPTGAIQLKGSCGESAEELLYVDVALRDSARPTGTTLS